MKKLTSLNLLAGVLLVITSSLLADTAVPAFINYQTYVTDENGSPLGNDAPISKDMVFRFFTTTTGGSPIYSEKQTCLIYKGQVSTLLGQGIQYLAEPKPGLYSIFVVPEIYLEVAIDDGTGTFLPITPRQRIASSPYAYRATIAESVIDQSITTGMIADASVTTGKISDKTITAAKIADNSITAAQIGTGAVTSDEILNGTITGIDLALSAVTETRLLDGAVTSSKIKDRTIVTADIALGAITANEIASETITASKIATSAVGTSEIQNGAIRGEDIASNTITADKLNGVFSYVHFQNIYPDKMLETGYSCDEYIAVVAGFSLGGVYDLDSMMIQPMYTAGSTWKIALAVVDNQEDNGIVFDVHVLFIRKSAFLNITH